MVDLSLMPATSVLYLLSLTISAYGDSSSYGGSSAGYNGVGGYMGNGYSAGASSTDPRANGPLGYYGQANPDDQWLDVGKLDWGPISPVPYWPLPFLPPAWPLFPNRDFAYGYFPFPFTWGFPGYSRGFYGGNRGLYG